MELDTLMRGLDNKWDICTRAGLNSAMIFREKPCYSLFLSLEVVVISYLSTVRSLGPEFHIASYKLLHQGVIIDCSSSCRMGSSAGQVAGIVINVDSNVGTDGCLVWGDTGVNKQLGTHQPAQTRYR